MDTGINVGVFVFLLTKELLIFLEFIRNFVVKKVWKQKHDGRSRLHKLHLGSYALLVEDGVRYGITCYALWLE